MIELRFAVFGASRCREYCLRGLARRVQCGVLFGPVHAILGSWLACGGSIDVYPLVEALRHEQLQLQDVKLCCLDMSNKMGAVCGGIVAFTPSL